MLLFYVFLPPLLFIFLRAYGLIKNYQNARKFGLPIILLPVSFEDSWWMPLRPLFAWVEHLPWGLGSWYVYTEMGWPTIDGNRTTARLGENFVLCSPSSNQIITCYRAGLKSSFGQHKNWMLPKAQSQLFAFYGQNVSSTNGTDWQRHRKITAAAFNEDMMERVWHESTNRAGSFDRVGERNFTLGSLRSELEIIAMQVLAVVGFGQDRSLTSIPSGHKESLLECLNAVLKHLILTLVFSGLKAPNFLLPRILRRLKVSVAELRLYMEESVLYQMRQSSSTDSKSQSPSLLEAMVKANEVEKQESLKKTARASYLTDSELYGNLFVFNIAGFETTASSMTFALPFLAAYRDVQDWIIEEVDRHYTASSDRSYATAYPKLVRCLACLYETLRVASPAPLLIREPTVAQTLPIITPHGESSIIVNPGTLVGGHLYGAHLSSRWGHDAETFNPKRFILVASNGDETLVLPDNVSFLPWMIGSRICPGKKFSQVEFVGVMARVLSNFCLRPEQSNGESEEEARARLLATLAQKYFNISAHLRQPESASVRFERR
ncbi:hypothetical protein N7462_011661 [Penicillium macrosclerotiorum]|uniref:uncharacterized protein n=1 Tax=Penicillium macrosclerotiorum TaxID=303699 RepID=UPI0025469C68|nr:uncharacterized protein N7462_011661 [Penicillium macrosclerotiorum]KAJ5662735.1 hypothetical protein N7462_011661 [Penicillium macrosclerotiorum]